jgi:hypothetical protein
VLQVEDPTVAAPGTVATEAAVPTTLSAAIGAFQLAFSGAPGGGSYIESQITLSGMLSDEFLISESFPTRVDVDQRETRFDNGTQLATYARVHTARRLAEYSAGLHAEFASRTNTPGHAHALNLAGFSYVLIGENYCSGVPFSTFDEAGAVVYGAPLTTNQMFEQAITYFDQAIAAATAAGSAAGAADQLNLARVGKARAQLNLNQPAAAATTAAPVPDGFVYRIFHSLGTGRQNNGIWGANQNRRGVTVSDMEGGTGLPYRTDADPRVIHLRGGTAGSGVSQSVGFDNSTPLWVQLKYPTQASQRGPGQRRGGAAHRGREPAPHGRRLAGHAERPAGRTAGEHLPRSGVSRHRDPGAAGGPGHPGRAGEPALQGAGVLDVADLAPRRRPPPPHAAVQPDAGYGRLADGVVLPWRRLRQPREHARAVRRAQQSGVQQPVPAGLRPEIP